MATKKKGTLTTSTEWAKHLRKFHKRKFWKAERKEAKHFNHAITAEEHRKKSWADVEHAKRLNSDFIVNTFDSTEWNQ